jgi:RNA 3'-terminal phosphate cyclase (GTP)
MLTIDGSYREGGGQILRTALALSMLIRRPFKIEKIRYHRPRPGLKHQHLKCIEAFRQLAPVEVKGAEVGSRSVEFIPGPVSPGAVTVDIGTAGSITLLLQALLLPVVFAPGNTDMRISGGTDVRWSVPLDYFTRVILPHFGDTARIDVTDFRRGYYPKGRGMLGLRVHPVLGLSGETDPGVLLHRIRTRLPPLDWVDTPEPRAVGGVSAASDFLKRADVCRRQIEGVQKVLRDRYRLQMIPSYSPTASPGSVIVLWGEPRRGKIALAADALGEKGVRAEIVGARAANRLLELLQSSAALDHHLADNLIPLMALTGGRLKPDRITDHILANIYVCERFLGCRFEVDPRQCLITLHRDP